MLKTSVLCHDTKHDTEDPPYGGLIRVKFVASRTSFHWCEVDLRRGFRTQPSPRCLPGQLFRVARPSHKRKASCNFKWNVNLHCDVFPSREHRSHEKESPVPFMLASDHRTAAPGGR
ncbi:hypothetical protein AVEN_141515-1 [Araneus ventricosus]|uniref:Uncharacterized protein n=1 Tax=Araneus ventricosus TaxID=182803 RepID=A0A4Y2T0V7_ARAVE|nr:hypothetical protein AVEN_229109-1 [Araneus ventricosus]GBN94248.1 hypothetical protein AVEN_141515-1 [Araneus ventricosus]